MRNVERRPAEGEFVSVASGRLKWTSDRDDLVAGRYRLRLLAPGQWETSWKGRVLRVDSRRSIALAAAEHHHREAQRAQQIVRWGLSAAAALLAAAISLAWIATLVGFLLFAAGAGLFFASLARLTAAITGNLLDPYRTRESWEPPDWWNRPE